MRQLRSTENQKTETLVQYNNQIHTWPHDPAYRQRDHAVDGSVSHELHHAVVAGIEHAAAVHVGDLVKLPESAVHIGSTSRHDVSHGDLRAFLRATDDPEAVAALLAVESHVGLHHILLKLATVRPR